MRRIFGNLPYTSNLKTTLQEAVLNASAIAQLMTAYVTAIPYADRDLTPRGINARHELYQRGLIKVYGQDYGIVLTEKGRVFCEMLLATPLPVEAPVVPQVAWKDPRS